MTNMLIIIIGLLECNFFYYYIQDSIHLQLSMKIYGQKLYWWVIQKKKTYIFWNVQKIRYRINVVSIFQNHDLLVKEKSISLKPFHFTTSIWYGTEMSVPDSMEMWETHVNLIFIWH